MTSIILADSPVKKRLQNEARGEDNRKLIKQEGALKKLCNSLMRNNDDEEIKATSSGKKSINKKIS